MSPEEPKCPECKRPRASSLVDDAGLLKAVMQEVWRLQPENAVSPADCETDAVTILRIVDEHLGRGQR